MLTATRPDTRKRLWWVPVLAAGAVLTAWRAWSRLTDPSLWGEDAYVFLKGARDSGPASLTERYAGYLHAVPRLLALAFRPLPLTWQPGLYAAAGTLLTLGFAALALSDRLDGVLPARWQRALLFGALVAAPARDEVTANLANLIFTGAVALLLLGLCRDPGTRPGRAAELAGAALLALGGILAVFVVPVLAVRAARLRTRHSTVLAAVVAGCGLLQLATLLTDPRAGDRTGTPGVAVSLVHHRLLPAWLVGDGGWTGAWDRHPVLLAVAVAALACVLAAAAVHLGRTGAALALTALLAVTAAGLTYRRIWYLTVAQRHLVLPLAVLAVLLVAALGARSAVLRAAAAAALAASLVAVHADWTPLVRPEQPVGPTAGCLAAHRTPCLLPANVSGPVYLDR